MKKFFASMLCAVGLVSFQAAAQGLLNAHQSVEIRGSIWKVWDAVKDFDGLHNWHPMFSDDVIKSGTNNEVGAIRTVTVKEGPSFDEELLSFDALERKYSYKILDPAPLPLSNYTSSIQVVESRRGFTTVLWRSSFKNNSDSKMKDEEVIGFIDGAYRAGLDNLRSMVESQ
jgi:mxaD protein